MQPAYYDIKRVPENGRLILPMTQAKLQGHQSPQAVYEFLKEFSEKIRQVSFDIVFLYGGGPSEGPVAYHRIRHRQELQSLILENRDFSPNSFHFLPWDYTLLNADRFSEFFIRLKRAYESDVVFHKIVNYDLRDRGVNEANIRWVLEELAVTHLTRQRFIEFPKTFSTSLGWSLIAYPGSYLMSDIYIYKKQILPRNPELSEGDVFSRSLYDYQDKQLIDFDKSSVAYDVTVSEAKWDARMQNLLDYPKHKC